MYFPFVVCLAIDPYTYEFCQYYAIFPQKTRVPHDSLLASLFSKKAEIYNPPFQQRDSMAKPYHKYEFTSAPLRGGGLR
jgi:hypothetical protein